MTVGCILQCLSLGRSSVADAVAEALDVGVRQHGALVPRQRLTGERALALLCQHRLRDAGVHIRKTPLDATTCSSDQQAPLTVCRSLCHGIRILQTGINMYTTVGWRGRWAHLPGGSTHDMAVGADGGADDRLQGDGVEPLRQRVRGVDRCHAVRPAARLVALVAAERRPPGSRRQLQCQILGQDDTQCRVADVRPEFGSRPSTAVQLLARL